MIVRLSNWLISTLRLYPSTVQVANIMVGSTSYGHAVALVSVSYNPSTNTITVVWRFTTNTNYRISTTPIVALTRFTGGFLVPSMNYTIPADYTWGQVTLQETITLIGAT